MKDRAKVTQLDSLASWGTGGTDRSRRPHTGLDVNIGKRGGERLKVQMRAKPEVLPKVVWEVVLDTRGTHQWRAAERSRTYTGWD